MHTWEFEDAQNRLNILLSLFQTTGPQEIITKDKSKAIVLSELEYEKLLHPVPSDFYPKRKRMSFGELIDRSPLKGVELDIKRDKTLVTRNIKDFQVIPDLHMINPFG